MSGLLDQMKGLDMLASMAEGMVSGGAADGVRAMVLKQGRDARQQELIDIMRLALDGADRLALARRRLDAFVEGLP